MILVRGFSVYPRLTYRTMGYPFTGSKRAIKTQIHVTVQYINIYSIASHWADRPPSPEKAITTTVLAIYPFVSEIPGIPFVFQPWPC